MENIITFKIKARYYLELLTPETMKLLGTTKSMINENKNGENMLRLEITEAVLIRSNIVTNDYQQIQESLYICS